MFKTFVNLNLIFDIAFTIKVLLLSWAAAQDYSYIDMKIEILFYFLCSVKNFFEFKDKLAAYC